MKSLIIIISNPAARGFSAGSIRAAADYLKRRDFETELLYTETKDHARHLAMQAMARKPCRIIAAGGDGTINEVLNGIAGSDIPLAILPLGTSNVLAKELNIPSQPEKAIERAVSGEIKTVSLGRIEALSSDSIKISRHFILMAGIGFDAGAVLDANRAVKRLSGEGAYILSGIKNLVSYNPEELCFTVDNNSYSGYAAIIGKASRYGGHFRVTPDADIHDPSFHICIFKGKQRLDLIRYAAGIVFGTHLKQKDIIYLKASRISVSGRAHIQIDGDYLGTTPAVIAVRQDALKLVY